ncbi:MAG: hypothetical protein ACRC8A_14225 [Microcoleaceae cyanobacterium]
MNLAKLKPEIRFRVSEELFAMIQDIQALGHFDSPGAAARFVVKLHSKNVLMYLTQTESGKSSDLEEIRTNRAEPPPSQADLRTQPADSQSNQPSGGFAKQFANLKQKIK